MFVGIEYIAFKVEFNATLFKLEVGKRSFQQTLTQFYTAHFRLELKQNLYKVEVEKV